MSPLAAPFKQLVERRLWPLAVLLVAALAAVPMMLSRDAQAPAPPAPVSTAAKANAASALATQPIVTTGDDATRQAARKVLGARKNPFKPTVKAKKADVNRGHQAPAQQQQDKPASPGGDTGGSDTIPTFTPPTGTPAVPKKVYELYSLSVRWGETSSDTLARRNLKRLKALPRVADPVVIYLGVLDDQKTAVFLVDHDATVQGDGDCEPTPRDCQTLHLRVGETAFIDVPGESGSADQQYQLDLVSLRKKRTTDARALRSEAEGGRAALRARMGRIGRLRYDAGRGTLRRLSSKAYKAEMSRASGR